MAKKKPYRKYLKGMVDEVLAISTLAARTLISADFDEAPIERTFISSVVASWAISDLTVSANDGPLMVGLAHSDYTDAQIEEYIENLGSWNEGGKVAQERARRQIRVVGILDCVNGVVGEWATLNEGKPIKTKLGWILVTGQTVSLWAYNLGSSAFATTDPQLHLQGHANLWPR